MDTPPARHPNAFAAAVTAGLAWVIYRVSLHYDWLHMSSQTALVVAGAAITAVLFVGRPLRKVGSSIGANGIGPSLRRIWSGPPKPAVPASEPAAVEEVPQP